MFYPYFPKGLTSSMIYCATSNLFGSGYTPSCLLRQTLFKTHYASVRLWYLMINASLKEHTIVIKWLQVQSMWKSNYAVLMYYFVCVSWVLSSLYVLLFYTFELNNLIKILLLNMQENTTNSWALILFQSLSMLRIKKTYYLFA